MYLFINCEINNQLDQPCSHPHQYDIISMSCACWAGYSKQCTKCQRLTESRQTMIITAINRARSTTLEPSAKTTCIVGSKPILHGHYLHPGFHSGLQNLVSCPQQHITCTVKHFISAVSNFRGARKITYWRI